MFNTLQENKLPNKAKGVQGYGVPWPLTHCWHGYKDGRLESENGALVSSEENWKKGTISSFLFPRSCVGSMQEH